MGKSAKENFLSFNQLKLGCVPDEVNKHFVSQSDSQRINERRLEVSDT